MWKKWKNSFFWNFKFNKWFLGFYMSKGLPVWHIRLVIINTWRICANYGLGWESKPFSRAKKVKKVKVYFLELQVQQAILEPYISYGFRVWLIWLFIISNKIEVNRFHPKPWFLKTHHIYRNFRGNSMIDFEKILQKILQKNLGKLRRISKKV